MTTELDESPYYYAGGKKVPLMPADNMVAVRSDEIDDKLSTMEEAEEIKSASVELRAGVSIVDQRDITESAAKVLKDNDVARPVFEIEGGFMVPLAEIRIEDCDETKLAEVSNWVKENSSLAEVISEREGRIAVKPTSDDPVDALNIANRITEEVGPEMSQVRFIRMVQRPGPKEPRRRDL
jgi:hypothetical protein